MSNAKPAGAAVYRTRPQRVEAILYTGNNLDAVVNWINLIDPDFVKVSGEWEDDDEVGPVDCRFADVYTIYGWDELPSHSYVLRFPDDTARFDVVESEEFHHRFVELGGKT